MFKNKIINCTVISNFKLYKKIFFRIRQIGAFSFTESREKMFRVEDSLCSVRSAIEKGIVSGGAKTFLILSKEINFFKIFVENNEQRLGYEILQKSLKYPLKIIFYNAGTNGAMVVEILYDSSDLSFGFNAVKESYCELFENGVVDPVKVLKTIISNACSVAKSFLTSNCIIFF